jgi:hypothetical protein
VRTISIPGALVRAAALMVLAAACASRAPSNRAATPSHEVLTSEDLNGKGFATVLEAIQSLRGHWLEKRGTDSFYSPSEIRVYLDGTLAGGLDALTTIPLMSVVYIRHYDAVTATARWGVGHGQGVIFISTHPNNDPI